MHEPTPSAGFLAKLLEFTNIHQKQSESIQKRSRQSPSQAPPSTASHSPHPQVPAPHPSHAIPLPPPPQHSQLHPLSPPPSSILPTNLSQPQSYQPPPQLPPPAAPVPARTNQQKDEFYSFLNTRNRTSISKPQAEILKKAFEKNPFVDNDTKEQLEAATGLPGRVVKIWFQNRRRENKNKIKYGNLT
ncbi:homeobox protein Hox-B4-like [Diabrotica virgifera virgifera]|uniref:Homeobox domain-containing protein n=1 Tax=Diabrotica virgifera virgifera TaxID=50390 RepID=A0ABM5JZT6_DIAVI|nr:homeobox protein Hox-B4-like [Diabrotica virgifera virgifera]